MMSSGIVQCAEPMGCNCGASQLRVKGRPKLEAGGGLHFGRKFPESCRDAAVSTCCMDSRSRVTGVITTELMDLNLLEFLRHIVTKSQDRVRKLPRRTSRRQCFQHSEARPQPARSLLCDGPCHGGVSHTPF